jgi:cobalt transporter subunit CbtA
MDTVRRLLLAGIGAGLLAGLVVSVVQFGTTTPLILEAESYELPEASHAPDHQAASASEADPARVAGTILANLVTGAGFGLLLVAAFAVRGEASGPTRGLAWGAAAFVAVVLAPALGLPPKLPGSRAAALEARQLWWLGTVLATAGALWLLAFGGRYRLLGLLAFGGRYRLLRLRAVRKPPRHQGTARPCRSSPGARTPTSWSGRSRPPA